MSAEDCPKPKTLGRCRKTLKTAGCRPAPCKGSLVKASSLREDGFAAALVLAVLIPLGPVCAGAFAPAEGRNEIFGKKYRL